MKINKINLKILLFFLLFIIAGSIFLSIYNKNMLKHKIKTKNYVTTQGNYISRELNSSDREESTYKLKYAYIVNEIEYYISTDYGTSVVPKINEKKDIKYNPNNPSEAYIVGINGNTLLLIIGILFIAFPIFFIGLGLCGISFGLFKIIKQIIKFTKFY